MPTTWTAPLQQGFTNPTRLNDESLAATLAQPTVLVQNGPATTCPTGGAWTPLAMNARPIFDHGPTPPFDGVTNSWLPPRGLWRFSCVISWDSDNTGTRRVLLGVGSVTGGSITLNLANASAVSSSYTPSVSSIIVAADGVTRHYLSVTHSATTARTCTANQAAWEWLAALD